MSAWRPGLVHPENTIISSYQFVKVSSFKLKTQFSIYKHNSHTDTHTHTHPNTHIHTHTHTHRHIHTHPIQAYSQEHSQKFHTS